MPSAVTQYAIRNTKFVAAFSLVEIMFAVMILGIGFIMIAAIFPVAIEQSRLTVSETTGTIVAESGVRALAAAPKTWLDSAPPISDIWGPFGLGVQQISSTDRRFGYLAFKRLAAPNTYELMAIAVESRNKAAFDDLSRNFELAAAYHACTFDLTARAGQPSIVVMSNANYGDQQIAEGAYLLVSNDVVRTIAGVPTTILPRGTVLQVGTQNDAMEWQLLPSAVDGWVAPLPYTASGVTGFIVGRGMRDPTLAPTAAGGSNPFEGPSMALHMAQTTTTK